MNIAIVAAVCMIIQDSLAVIKYQAAARNKGMIAAAADVVCWYVAITTTTIAAFTLHGNNFGAKVAVVAAITCANIAGNLLGTYLGRRFVVDEESEAQDDRLDAIEERLTRLETKEP